MHQVLEIGEALLAKYIDGCLVASLLFFFSNEMIISMIVMIGGING